jgi:hypothetical protein
MILPRTDVPIRPGGPGGPPSAIQSRIPTVGDTIWLTRRVTTPPGAEVRAPAWTPEEGLALLGRPIIRTEGGTTVISWPAVAWTAGRRTISVPGPVIIRADGVTDSLPAEAQVLEVASVLPDSTPIDKIPPQPEAGIVLERITSPWPVLVAVLAALLIIGPLAWWWRRRGPVAGAAPGTVHPPVWPLSEWSESGEGRAVAAVAARNLRTTLVRLLPGTPPGLVTSRLIRIMREQRPAWPIADLSRVLEALEAVQFSSATPAAVLALASEAEELRLAVESLGVKAGSGVAP